MNYGGASVPETVVISIQLTCDAEKQIQSQTRPCYLNNAPVHTPLKGTTLPNITLLTPHYITGITRFADRITDGSLSGFTFTTLGKALKVQARCVTVKFWTAKTNERYKLL